MFKFLTFFVVALACVSLFSCSDDDSADFAEVAYDGPTVDAAGGVVKVLVSANGTWIISASQSWARLSPDHGNGDTEVFITFPQNPNLQARTLSLTVKSGSAVASCDVSQDGRVYVIDPSQGSNASNVNANSDSAEPSLSNFCMPRVNPANTLVPHYASVGGASSLNFLVEWNPVMLHSNWVAFFFDADNCAKNVKRSDEFEPDPLLPVEQRTDNSYHTSDGFDRGHICASYDRAYSSETNKQTFYFSNMSPQLNEFNAGIWLALEDKIQKWGGLTATGRYDRLYVAKGGTLNHLLKNYTGAAKAKDGVVPSTNAEGFSVKGLPVPEYYFMAILAEKDGQFNSIAFLLHHLSEFKEDYPVSDLKNAVVSIDSLEEFTGIDFFCNLPDVVENDVESDVDLSVWQW